MSDRAIPPLNELELPTWPQPQSFWTSLRTHWAQIAWLIGSVSVIATTLVSLLGLRVSGPRDAIAAGERRDSLLTERVVRLEVGAVRFQRSLTFQSYLLCKQTSRTDPVARERCEKIIADELAQGSP